MNPKEEQGDERLGDRPVAFGGGREAETSGLGGPLLLRKGPSREWGKTS